MKKFGTNFKVILSALILMLIGFDVNSSFAEDKNTQCLHNTDYEKLKKIQGNYVLSSLLDDIKESKDFSKAMASSVGYHEIQIDDKGQVLLTLNYHEGLPWDANGYNQDQCISQLDKDTFVFHSVEDTGCKNGKCDGKKEVINEYKRTDITSSQLFFNILLNGCYMESHNTKWCFKKGGPEDRKVIGRSGKEILYDQQDIVTIGDKKYKAVFVLDGMELPQSNAILQVDGEDLFWAFYKTEKGLKICKTEVISKENYKTEPCKELIKEQTNHSLP